MPIIFFQLRNKSQKVFNNVFGVPTYQGAIGKYNPVDYNHFKVGVCPNCFFASMDIKMFRQKEQTTPPEILIETDFFEKWHASLDERKKQFQAFGENFCCSSLDQRFSNAQPATIGNEPMDS